MSLSAEKLHKEAIIIDAACPLVTHENYFRNYRAGGTTVACATVGYGVPAVGTLDFTVKNLGGWYNKINENSGEIMLVTSVNDIYQAKKEDKLGIVFHFQGSLPIEDDINNLEVYHRLGLRMFQLCYNAKDLVGCGTSVADDSGLTEFGADAIKELNRLGIVVDCSHTGYKTTFDAIDVSKSPVIVSHGNAKAVWGSARNLPDELIDAVAENGGVIGIAGYPAFVSEKPQADIDDLLKHLDHIVMRAGIKHACLGLDYYEYQAGVMDDATAKVMYDYLLESGAWAPGEYPPPPWHYPAGIEMPEKLPNLTSALLEHGYSEDDVMDVLGLNLVRVFGQVWEQD